MTDIGATLARLTALHPKLIDLSLDRIHRLLAALDHPQRRLPPVIHVAGTNGKGSTVAFLRAMLEAAGQRVHVYTSPHLVAFNERFRLGGALVSDADLDAALEECERANDGAPITVFEITTAAGLLLFSRNPADILLLEVGLGGRLDATNVIDRPLASVITPVALDHAEYLGTTLESVAAEKAGIVKRGVPVIVARQSDEAMRVIETQADSLRAPVVALGQHWMVAQERGRLVYQDDDGLLDLPAPRLFGRHQFDNAATAIAALRSVGPVLTQAHFEQGLLNAEWPARMQRLTQGALTSLIPAGAELWLDGGHNPDGGRAIAAALGDLEDRAPKPLVVIVGMLNTKDAGGFLRNFSGLARKMFGIAVPGQAASMSARELSDAAVQVGIDAEPSDNLAHALSQASDVALGAPPRILITGSLYLAGDVLAQNGTPPR